MPQAQGQAVQFDWSSTLQLILLLSAIPAQYFIVTYSSNNQQQTEKAIKDLYTNAQKYGEDLVSSSAWRSWFYNILHKFMGKLNKSKGPWPSHPLVRDGVSIGESPAVEVMLLESPQGYFANSLTVRSPRPDTVLYRVGQVITHKVWGYRGVIIGWDSLAKAPDDWLARNHPKDKTAWKKQPNYAILVDTRDHGQAQVTYIPQENIVLETHMQVENLSISDYFDGFDGQQYVARPALRSLYPDD